MTKEQELASGLSGAGAWPTSDRSDSESEITLGSESGEKQAPPLPC